MNISTQAAQLNNGGKLFLNATETGVALEVTGYVVEDIIHLIAWHANRPCVFSLIAIEKKDYTFWMAAHRYKYAKVILVEVGGFKLPKKDKDA